MAPLPRLTPVALLTCALTACGAGPASDHCQAYQATDNVIRDAADWRAFVDSGCRIVRGHLTLLAGSADPASVPAVEEVTGGVAISLADPYREVALPHLRTIGAALLVGESDSQETIRLPLLTSIGQGLSVWNNARLGVLDLPALASCGERFWVSSNAALRALDFPTLAAVPGNLDIQGNGSLASASFPALSTAGLVTVDDNPALATCSLPALTEATDGLWLIDLPALAAVDLPALQAVGTVQYAAGLHGSHLHTATRISLPALRRVSGELEIAFNDALGALSVPALESVRSLQVMFNPVYPECEALALRDRLAASGLGGSSIRGNDAAAICP